jgi:hypothetical protein
MKSKDQTLLEEAYVKVQLNEGLAETFLKPLFTKIIQALKEKAPDVFNKLASAKNPEELLNMLRADKVQQQNESVMDTVSKVKQAASDLLNALASPNPIAGNIVMAILGKIIMLAGMITGAGTEVVLSGGAMGIAGLLFSVISAEIELRRK